jgi:hypothetical protein
MQCYVERLETFARVCVCVGVGVGVCVSVQALRASRLNLCFVNLLARPRLLSLRSISSPQFVAKTRQEHHSNEMTDPGEKPMDACSDNEEVETLLGSHIKCNVHGHDHTSSSRWKIWSVLILVMISCGTSGYFIGSRMPTNADCARKFSTWSEHLCHHRSRFLCDLNFTGPARHIVRYEELRMQGDFYRPSRYRGPPSPAIDSAWDDLWMGMLVITPESLRRPETEITSSWRRPHPYSG